MNTHITLGLLFALYFAPSFAATPPFGGDRLKGINVTLATNPTAADYARIRDWGANSIRLVVHVNPGAKRDDNLLATKTSLEVRPAGVARLKESVDLAVANDLKVVIDMHSWPCRAKGEFWESLACWESYRVVWREIARTFKNESGVVGYDLMNEPDLVHHALSDGEFGALQERRWSFPEKWRGTTRDYFKLMRLVAADISEIDQTKTLIVNGVGAWGKPYNFQWMEPIQSASPVCYAFHMYVPNRFTDQGKQRKGKQVAVGIRYPFVWFGREQIYASMDDVVRFQRKYDACIYVGEYGVMRETEGLGGDRWLADVHAFFDDHGWHSAYWSYSIPLRSPLFRRGLGGDLVVGEGERLRALTRYWRNESGKVKDSIKAPGVGGRQDERA